MRSSSPASRVAPLQRSPLPMLGLGLLALALSGCGGDDDEGGYRVRVQVTPYGIPHLEAADWGSLGYGYGYHFASDNLCVLARHLLRVRGELSATFGIEGEMVDNFASDVISRHYLSDSRMRQTWEHQEQRLKDLVAGYAAGYNRYLQEIPQGRHRSCRDEAWLRPMSSLDAVRVISYISNLAVLSRPEMMRAMVAAEPQQVAAEPQKSDPSAFDGPVAPMLSEPLAGGSNAWGLGHYSSQNRRPLLLGNPHYPWHGMRRFYQAHFTIPGELDVMGAAIYGSPMTNIGFTNEFAWTHTVSAATRFTLYELTIKPDDPMKYLYDGVWLPVRDKEIVVEVLQNGEVQMQRHSLYFTEFGVLLNMSEMLQGAAWTDWPNSEGRAYAMRDISGSDDQAGAQILSMVTAGDLDAFVDSLKRHLGLSFVNTVAIGRLGDAWYGDITTVPFVTNEQWDSCMPTTETGRRLSDALGQSTRSRQAFPVLDGTRSECQWQVSDEATRPGLMPADLLPELKTRQYVANSNDSYWLTNLDVPITGLPRVLGGESYQVSLRTQMGLRMIEDRQSGTDGKDRRTRFSIDNLKELALAPRNGAGELVADEIGRLCIEENDVVRDSERLRKGCAALNGWQLTNGVDDRGGMLFNRIWLRIRNVEGLFEQPFSIAQPLNTPRYLRVQDRAIQDAIFQAIEEEVAFFERNNLDPDAPLGELQYVVRNGDRIPIPGGPPGTGSFNMIQGVFDGRRGWSDVEYGNSYVQVVTWDKKAENVLAEAILTYSQSTDPDSPHYADQTRLYSEGGWVALPFRAEEVEAAAVSSYELTGARQTP